MNKSAKLTLTISVFIFIVSFFLRFYGLWNNHPFWVDEFSTADQARQILQFGPTFFLNNKAFFEPHNITTYSLVALFFRFFGEHEWVARFPFVLIGSLVPMIVFLLTKKVLNLTTAISVSLLTIFSYYEIVWSRQARGYALLQLFILIVLYVYIKLIQEKKTIFKYFVFLIFISFLGIMTHAFFFLLVFALFVHYLFFQLKIKKSNKIILNYKTFIVICFTFFLLQITGMLSLLLKSLFVSRLSFVNNFWYYHSFLWREYGLITFLGILGLGVAYKLEKKISSIFIFYAIVHLFFISFFLGPYTSRYILPIFPLFLIGTAYVIHILSTLLTKNTKLSTSISIFIISFIIGNGYKFVNKPKAFYSVNHDFREIALIDYHKVYEIIKNKSKNNIVVIETWPARAYWYLGHYYQPIYIFKWKNERISINGFIIQRSKYNLNKKGEKIFQGENNLKLIEDTEDLQKVIQQYKKGFIFIDDSSLPKDVREYAEKNLKKELYLDHYPLDDNPYSIWPATLYSWGV